jgi:hypothetical protein
VVAEQGWLVFLNRVLQPESEPQPTVVTCSFTIYMGDDSSYNGSLSDPGSVASEIVAMANSMERPCSSNINLAIDRLFGAQTFQSQKPRDG